MSVILHPLATCCWCRASLVQVEGHWWCPTLACRTRQVDHCVARTIKKGAAPTWLYVPTPKQVEFDSCPAKYVLYGGAAGPGKSHAARWALYRRCLRIKNFRALLLRRTYPELESTHLDKMSMEADLVGAVFTKSERTLSFPATGALIRCGHMDDPAAVQKYLSTEYDVIVPDEGSTYEPDPLLELSTRARTSNPQVLQEGGAKFWIPSNPGGPSSSMLLDFFIDHQPDTEKYPALATEFRPDEWVYIPATLDDNPYIDPAYVRQLATLSKWRYEQLRHGDWRVFSGQFFHTFNERRHVKDLGTPEHVKWFRSMDWGFNAPGCWGWYAILPDGRLYCRADRKFHGESVQVNAQELKKQTMALGIRKVSYDVGDPAIWAKTGLVGSGQAKYIGQSIGETFTRYGIAIGRGDNDRYNGWMRVHDLLRDAPDGDPWIVFHPDARYTIRSLAQAKSDPKDPDDVDTHSDDHALDKLRYAAMSRPSPGMASKTTRYAPGTMGALRQSVKPAVNRLGSESVHA